MRVKQFYVYIMTNKRNTVIYTGVTKDLRKRVYEHKQKLVEGFTKKYNVVKLVYYEVFSDGFSAIQREKQIKAGSRKKKEELINSPNFNLKRNIFIRSITPHGVSDSLNICEVYYLIKPLLCQSLLR